MKKKIEAEKKKILTDAEERLQDVNSNVNQKIKSDFIAREVLHCFSYGMAELLEKQVVNYEDIKNLYKSDEAILSDSCDTDKMNEEEKEEYIQSVKDRGEDVNEIYEYWIVTEYLYRKLEEAGEPVIEWGDLNIWGRCCTGQAILLDSVISDICSDMEILEGQKYDWSRK